MENAKQTAINDIKKEGLTPIFTKSDLLNILTGNENPTNEQRKTEILFNTHEKRILLENDKIETEITNLMKYGNITDETLKQIGIHLIKIQTNINLIDKKNLFDMLINRRWKNYI